MSYRFDFDPTNRILRCLFTGRVTDEELKDYYSDASQYTAQTDALAGITDFSAAEAVDASPETVRDLASLPPVMTDVRRVRCIVAPSDKVFGLARMFELQGGHTRANLHVVRTVKEALAILGAAEPRFEPLTAK